jgi:energy-coupling factor transporter ATP-binding protein EcfA2
MVDRKHITGQETVTILDPKTEFTISYSMSSRLKGNLDKIKDTLQTKDKDCVFVIDGKEGSGKSTLAMQIGKYVDPTLDVKRIVFSPDDFREAILKAKKGQCIIYDEAFTGFSSRSSLSPVNRVLVSLAMQMRQKNLFILIVLPTIYMLDKYMAMFRTKALIHVHENHGQRGYFRVFNSRKKKLLLLLGSKTMSYTHKKVWTNNKGRFYGKFVLGDEKMEKLYLTNKEKALSDSEKTSMSSAQVKYREQRDLMLWLFKKYTKMTYQEVEQVISDYDFNISFQQISKICLKFGDYSLVPKEKDIKIEEIAEIDDEIEENDDKIDEIDDLDVINTDFLD